MRLIDADALLEELNEFEQVANNNAWVNKLGVNFARDETGTYPYKYDTANLLFSIFNDGKEHLSKFITNAPTVQREGWKPIKSAPKGEAVLVAGGDCDYPCVANYSGHPDECWCVDGQMDTYTEIGWPTHWMPLDSLPELPAAPTDTE